ncbi:MAG: hypothetical protein Q9M91_01020 [Candidatus Dojkabacteria bacterium]|nr:hypothetical protein [Candidatus Dojkabacteria bacterium]MDQ7020408.1 hypothetical protein [Candidatus Dojkabacteria bacterium]
MSEDNNTNVQNTEDETLDIQPQTDNTALQSSDILEVKLRRSVQGQNANLFNASTRVAIRVLSFLRDVRGENDKSTIVNDSIFREELFDHLTNTGKVNFFGFINKNLYHNSLDGDDAVQLAELLESDRFVGLLPEISDQDFEEFKSSSLRFRRAEKQDLEIQNEVIAKRSIANAIAYINLKEGKEVNPLAAQIIKDTSDDSIKIRSEVASKPITLAKHDSIELVALVANSQNNEALSEADELFSIDAISDDTYDNALSIIISSGKSIGENGPMWEQITTDIPEISEESKASANVILAAIHKTNGDFNRLQPEVRNFLEAQIKADQIHRSDLGVIVNYCTELEINFPDSIKYRITALSDDEFEYLFTGGSADLNDQFGYKIYVNNSLLGKVIESGFSSLPDFIGERFTESGKVRADLSKRILKSVIENAPYSKKPIKIDSSVHDIVLEQIREGGVEFILKSELSHMADGYDRYTGLLSYKYNDDRPITDVLSAEIINEVRGQISVYLDSDEVDYYSLMGLQPFFDESVSESVGLERVILYERVNNSNLSRYIPHIVNDINEPDFVLSEDGSDIHLNRSGLHKALNGLANKDVTLLC